MPEKCFEYNKLITYADYTGGGQRIIIII